MRVFKDLNLVEQLGTGIKRILKYYNEDIYEFTPNFIKVDFAFNKNTLSNNYNINNKELNNTQLEILSLMKQDEFITQEQMADKMKINRVNIAKNIRVLKEKGYIIREGSNKVGNWKILK